MNYRLLAKVFGSILLLLSTAQGLCLLYALVLLFQSHPSPGIQGLLPSTLICLGCGFLFLFLGRGCEKEILRKEAAVIVGLGWIVSAIFGAIPYLMGEPQLGIAKAFFESMSGFTTTGSTVVADLENGQWSPALLLWRSLSQWLGGLGILVLFVALLAYLGEGNKAVFSHESSMHSGESTMSRISSIARSFALTYLAWTLFATLGLWILSPTAVVEMGFYDALCHALTAVATGGFSPYNASVGHFQSTAIELLLVFVMLGCSINMLIYPALITRQWGRIKREEEGRTMLIIAAIATFLVFESLTWRTDAYDSRMNAFLDGLFYVASLMSTTGFGTNWREAGNFPESYAQWPGLSESILIMLMLIGGSSGSTAGGIKVVRIIIFLRMARQEIVRSFRPRRVYRLVINGKEADPDFARQSIILTCLFAFCLALGSLIIALLEPDKDLLTCTTATIATLFNIGPGLGEVGPTKTFAEFSNTSLFLLSLLMALGRLELLTVLALFAPSLWRKY